MFDKIFKGSVLAIATGGLAAPVLAASDEAMTADGKVEVGTLTCELTDVNNIVVYSNETFSCRYEGTDGSTHMYNGEIDSVGLNLEFKADEVLKWAVVAPATIEKPNALEGEYVGASAGASVGAGVSGNVLVGGSEDQFALQPVAVSATSGLGAALTIDNFTLTYVN